MNRVQFTEQWLAKQGRDDVDYFLELLSNGPRNDAEETDVEYWSVAWSLYQKSGEVYI